MRPLIRDARGLLGEHEGSVRDARGAAKIFANHMIDKNVDVSIVWECVLALVSGMY